MAKILIVEDETIVAWDIKETLEKLGHTVIDLVVSGTEALGAAFNDSPDLVLMDIRLEGDLDGIAAGDEIYQSLKIPIVYLTAHADELTLARATRTNPFGYVLKPFQPQSLQSAIKVALQRHQVEVAAQINQAYLTNTLNSIGSGMIATDRHGLVTSINPIAEALTGWDKTAALGQYIDRIFRLIWETDGTEIENPCSRAMRLKQPIKSSARCWLVAKDGNEIPISDTATPIFNADGVVIGSIIVFQDNTESVTAQVELWEQNQDLEFFQRRLTSQLSAKTAECQQAVAWIQILELISTKFDTVYREDQLIQLAIAQFGITIDADYCWYTTYNPQNATGMLECEYINPKQQIYPTSKLGKEIDILRYPQFYNHLFENEIWIDPPLEVIPQLYQDLATSATQMLICPIIVVDPSAEDREATAPHGEAISLGISLPEARAKVTLPPKTQLASSLANRKYHQTIGEVGIITTGKSPWTIAQATAFANMINFAVKLFRQTHPL
jgi:PAS domain S-box-containing protein